MILMDPFLLMTLHFSQIGFTDDLTSVSYTHLDVYKRQDRYLHRQNWLSVRVFFSFMSSHELLTLLHKSVDRFFQFLDSIPVSMLHCIHDAVFYMILQDDLACIIDRRFYG